MKIIKIASSQELLQFLDKWRSRGVSLFVYEGKDYLKLSEIVVPKGERGQGIGTEVMNDLVSLSERLRKRVLLTPDTSYGGSSVKRLRDFYKRFDFVENKGRNKDWSTTERMYRDPKEESQDDLL